MNTVNKLLLKGGKVLFEDGFKFVDIILSGEKILEVGKGLPDSGNEVIDCTGKIIAPGFLDVHVHFREPGFEYKEDISSGSYSALAGGYTKVYAMPNTNPCIDNQKIIQHYNKLSEEKSLCDLKTYSAMSKDLKGQELVDILEISKLNIAGFTDDGKGFQSTEKMAQVMEKISQTNKVLCVHSEDEQEFGEVMGCVNEGVVSQENNLIGINNASEWKMLKRDLELLENYNLPYHLCHMSTMESLNLIKSAKEKGLNVSAEVTPHHLILNDMDIPKNDKGVLDSNYKMNPPLRSEQDRQALVNGLINGDINIIATDHAPHSIDEKEQTIDKAPFGIVGLEQAYSVLNTYLIREDIVPEEVILQALSYNPARRFSEDIRIIPGMKSNLVVLNKDSEVIYTNNSTYSKGKNSPFMDKKLYGKVEYTILGSKIYKWK